MRVTGLILCMVGMVMGISLNAQDTLRIIASNQAGMTGNQVCIDYSVEHFINIQNFQFSLHFDPTVVRPVCPPNATNLIGLNPTNFNCNRINEGFIRMLWLDPNNGVNCGESLPDGFVMFTFCFDIIGDPGTETSVYVSGDQLEAEYAQIRDCSDTDDVTVIKAINIDPGSIIVQCGTLSVFSNFCDSRANESTGSLRFYVCGGTEPYSYSINGGAFSGSNLSDRERVNIENLQPGTYNIVVIDGMGNTTNETVNIGTGTPLDFDILGITNPSCWNRSTGSMQYGNIRGGQGPYSVVGPKFQFDPQNERFTGLVNGTYEITVSDASGCNVTKSVSLLNDTLRVDIDLVAENSCQGAANGVIRVTGSGGRPYNGVDTYRFNNGSISSQLLRDDYDAGWHYFFISDLGGNNCTSEVDSIFIPNADTLVNNLSFVPVVCSDDENGSITIQATSNSLTDFQYSITDLNGSGVNTGVRSDAFTLSGLRADTYVITSSAFRNGISLGCSVIDTLVIDNPDPFDVDTSFLNPSCNGDDGSINLSPSGGVANNGYEYVWSDGDDQQNRTNLVSGMYEVTVTDDNGCSHEFNFLLEGEDGLEVTASIVNTIQCFDSNDGELTVDVNIQGDFSFNWLLDGQPFANTQTINGLGPGEYTITVRDTIRDCENSDVITLTAPEELILVANFILPTCPGFSNGSIGAIVAGGTMEYSYLWDNGSTNTVRAAIDAGSYEVTVTDAAGCTISEIFTLTDPAEIVVDVQNIVGVTCFGEENGQATATAAGGTVNNGNYNFFWASGAPDVATGVNTSTATSLGAGRQYLIVTDAECTADTVFFDVPDIEPIILDMTNSIIEDPDCFNGCDGMITAVATGGNSSSFTYQWTFNGSVSNTISGLCSGVYNLTITDANNCSVQDSFTLVNPDSLFINIDASNTVDVNCFNAGEAQIGVIADGGTPEYTYTWTNNVSNGSIATSLPDGTYFITVTDMNGCTDVTSYTLVSPEPIQAVIPQPDAPPCFGERTCITVSSVTGGVGSNYTFTINRGVRIPLDSCVQVFAGEYTVSVFDEAGCNEDYSLSIEQPENLVVELGPDIQISLGESSPPINASIQSFFDIQSIAWTPVDSLRCMTNDCQVITVSPQSDTRYSVIVTDENGCTSSDEIMVLVSKRRNVFMANIFSPNQDGFNDVFEVKTGPGIEIVRQFHIFDRWGNVVFTRENFVPDNAGTHGWDGTYHNQPAMPGVYAYIAKVRFIDNEEIVFKGSITLIR